MKRLGILFLLMAIAEGGSIGFSQSAPENDAFTNSIELQGTNFTASATLVGATGEEGEPGSPGSSVWYSWAPPNMGRTWIGAADLSDFALYTGSSLESLQLVQVVPADNHIYSFLA